MFILKSKHFEEVRKLRRESDEYLRRMREVEFELAELRRRVAEPRILSDKYVQQRLALASSLALTGIPADRALKEATVIYPVPA